jgi:hypothetical protein
MIFDELPEYGKDLKGLTKRYRSLPEDIGTLKKALKAKPNPSHPLALRLTA